MTNKNLCIVAPRFHPVIGGAENYLKDIVIYCSNFIKTTVITSNLKSNPTIFEKQQYIKNQNDYIYNNIEIIRAHTLKNILLKNILYLNEFVNNRSELIFDRFFNPNIYKNHFLKLNQKVSNNIFNFFILQNCFKNPNFQQIYFILKKIHKKHNELILHSSPIYFSSNMYAYLFSKKFKIPYICTPLFHIKPFANKYFYPTYQQILKNSNAIITLTNIEKAFYIKYGIDKNKISVIPPGIDPKNYKKESNKNEFKEKHNISESTPLLLFMARRGYEKGIYHSIFSLKYLIKKFKDIKLILIGPKTRYFNFLYSNIPKELKDHIIDLGIADENTKIDALDNCDIFILPSIDDAFGIVYLEAWLFKKPVIGVLGGNVEGLIDNNINGLLINFNEVKDLSKKIEILLTNNDMRQNLGQNGYNKLMRNYLLNITNKQILELYKTFM